MQKYKLAFNVLAGGRINRRHQQLALPKRIDLWRPTIRHDRLYTGLRSARSSCQSGCGSPEHQCLRE